jgi:steroid delta-isomerase-like uncharacterized protein
VSDDIKATQRRFVDQVQNEGNIDAVDDFIAEDCVDHTPFPGLPPDREGAKQIFEAIRAGFPDHDAEVVHMVAEGDTVATYKTFTGTHEGEFMGISPTGKKVTIRVMDFVRYRDGKIAEHWNIVDQAGLLQQLGATPS